MNPKYTQSLTISLEINEKLYSLILQRVVALAQKEMQKRHRKSLRGVRKYVDCARLTCPRERERN